MGFFKNLFKGKFKKIGQNAVKNIASGQLIKGGGIIGGIINKATSKFVKPASAVLTKFGIGQTGGYRPPTQSIGRPNPYVQGGALYQTPGIMPSKPNATQKALATAEITDGVAKGEIDVEDAKRAMIDINGDGQDDSSIIYLVGGAIALWLILKKK